MPLRVKITAIAISLKEYSFKVNVWFRLFSEWDWGIDSELGVAIESGQSLR